MVQTCGINVFVQDPDDGAPEDLDAEIEAVRGEDDDVGENPVGVEVEHELDRLGAAPLPSHPPLV